MADWCWQVPPTSMQGSLAWQMIIHWNGTVGVALPGCAKGFQLWVSVLSTDPYVEQGVVVFSRLTWADVLELKSALWEDWLRWSLGSRPHLNSNLLEHKDDLKKGECWRVGSLFSLTSKSEELW